MAIFKANCYFTRGYMCHSSSPLPQHLPPDAAGREVRENGRSENDPRQRTAAGSEDSSACLYPTGCGLNMERSCGFITQINHTFGNAFYQYGDLGDGLLLLYPQ